MFRVEPRHGAPERAGALLLSGLPEGLVPGRGRRTRPVRDVGRGLVNVVL